MKLKSIITSTILSILCVSCRDANFEERESLHAEQTHFTMKFTSGIADTQENKIETINLYSFRKKSGEENYTFEKTYPTLIPHNDGDGTDANITLDGSLERIIYLLANKSGDIPFLEELNGSTSEKVFEEWVILHNRQVPQSPYLMAAKQIVPAVVPGSPVTIRFDRTLACLDIDNQYLGLSIDSLVVKDAVCGTKLFSSDTPSVELVERSDINYGNSQQVYLYQTDASVLAIYGKIKGIRAVFDIPLNKIKKSTEYHVTFRNNNTSVDLENNLSWDISQWKDGPIIESSPDWI